ncbi:MAG: OmpH family outer membrane protein [Saprospiraceae bacterium]|nr:OmpH family outer membrane protein [Saprospiraceae bacterium]
MIRKTFFLLAILFSSTAVSLNAQTDSLKYGHMNLGNLLDELPETARAEATLRVFADSLNQKDSLLTQTFQAAYLQLKKEYDDRSLTGIQVQQRQAELEKQRQEIQQFEQDAQKQLDERRAELLRPILTRIDEAIKAVAKENGFMMIFDVSSGSMLFAAETIDVTPLVKKKLGI